MSNIHILPGSWMAWFAEREPQPGASSCDISPREPMRKVDPKYISDAANAGVAGIVWLTAVISQDGRVGEIEQRLDDRLDRNAEEALSKWRFRPAERYGISVDVGAVFEIRFRLAPRPVR